MHFILFQLYWSIIALRIPVRYVVRCLSIRFCLVFFLWLEHGYGFGVGDHKQTPLSSYLTTSMYYQNDPSPLIMTLITQLETVFVRSLHHEVKLLFSPLHTMAFGKKSLCSAHTCSGLLPRTVLGGVSMWIIWKFLNGSFLSFLLFVYLFISVWTPEYLAYVILILHK